MLIVWSPRPSFRTLLVRAKSALLGIICLIVSAVNPLSLSNLKACSLKLKLSVLLGVIVV